MIRLSFFSLIICFSTSLFAQYTKVLSTNDTTYSFTDAEFELLSAASKGDTNKLLAFLKIGTNVNATTWDDVTPLMYAAQNGHLRCVEILIDKGADVSAKPFSELDALTVACIAGHALVADTLILNGAYVDSRNNDGLTPLMWAAAYNHKLVADILLFYGAKVNTADNFGNTPLHFSCFYASNQTTALLLEKGAIADVSDMNGFTPLMVAAQNGHFENLELLLQAGADINKTNNQNLNALALATINRNTAVINYLLQNEADPRTEISEQLNLYDIAMLADQKQTTSLLDSIGLQPAKGLLIYQWGVHYLMDFNSTDLMLGGSFSLSEAKYGINIEAGFRTRPAVRSVLYEKDVQSFYQFWEKRSILHLAIEKTFPLVQFDPNQKLNAFAGLGFGYTYGSFRGSSLKPDDRGLLIPLAGFEYQYKLLSLKLNYEYLKLKNSKTSPHRIELQIGMKINMYNSQLKLKEEPIF